MSEEEIIEELKRLLYTNTLTQYGKRKLINYYEEKIEKLQKENEEKDKIIDLLIKELYTKAHISTRCYLQTSTEECMKYKNCYECLKKHFENKERRNNGKGN